MQTGQGFTEYIAMLAFLAVAAIGSASYFGQVIRGMKSFVANELAGTGNSSPFCSRIFCANGLGGYSGGFVRYFGGNLGCGFCGRFCGGCLGRHFRFAR